MFQVILLSLSVADLALVKAVPFILQDSSLQLVFEACALVTPSRVSYSLHCTGKSRPHCKSIVAKPSALQPNFANPKIDSACFSIRAQGTISTRGKLTKAITERSSSWYARQMGMLAAMGQAASRNTVDGECNARVEHWAVLFDVAEDRSMVSQRELQACL